jgi:hypothetical protein
MSDAHGGEHEDDETYYRAVYWHQYVLENWDKVKGVPSGARVPALTEKLLTTMRNDKSLKVLTQHERKCLALDLVCASFPHDRPPSWDLVEVLKMALDLPEDHDVGYWALGRRGKHGHFADGRGSKNKQDIYVWWTSIEIDKQYFRSHGTRMPLRQLERTLKTLKGKFPGRPPGLSTLRGWRKLRDYVHEAFQTPELPF